MTDINWNLLGRPVDIGGAVQQGFAAGQLQKRQQQTQDILASYGQNPSAGVPGALAALAPNAYATLSQNDRQRVVADRQTQDALRETRAAGNYATFLRESQRDVLAPPAASLPAATDANGGLVVTGRRVSAPAARTVSIADIAADSPELARQLTTHMGSLSKEHREDVADHFGAAAAVAAQAMKMPPDARRAFVDSQRDYLALYGWQPDQLDGADLSDAGLNGLIALGIGADSFIDNARADQSEQRQAINQARSDARASRSEARAERADRRAAIRFGERDKDRAALSGNFGISNDLSDLDY